MTSAQFCYYTNWTYEFKDGKIQNSNNHKVDRKVIADYISLGILIN